MYAFADNSPFDVEDLRARLRRMDDEMPLGFGRSAAYMCSPWATLGKPPRDVFVVQLSEAREEWRRRRRAMTSIVFTEDSRAREK